MEVPVRIEDDEHGGTEPVPRRGTSAARRAPAIVGVFDNINEAERAYEDLRALAVGADEVALVAGPADEVDQPGGGNVLGAAATGATLGGLLGACAGWMTAVGALPILGVGAEAHAGQLASTVGGLLLGGVIGALAGALSGLGPARADVDDLRERLGEGRVLVVARPASFDPAQAETVLQAGGASQVRSYKGDIVEHLPASSFTGVSTDEGRTIMVDRVDRVEDGEVGRDPEAVTGTEGTFDPETGAYGTAGTPLTTGYGVSGATVGTGSPVVEEQYRSQDVSRATPDTPAYNIGGRASGDADAPIGGEPTERPRVEDLYGDRPADQEAHVQIAPDATDVYEAGPSYGPDAGATSMQPNEDRTDYYSGSSVYEGPSYGTVDTSQAQASEGTDMPGTADPRGLGDNTDDPDRLP